MPQQHLYSPVEQSPSLTQTYTSFSTPPSLIQRCSPRSPSSPPSLSLSPSLLPPVAMNTSATLATHTAAMRPSRPKPLLALRSSPCLAPLRRVSLGWWDPPAAQSQPSVLEAALPAPSNLSAARTTI